MAVTPESRVWEALFAERSGDPVEHVTPPQTFKIENPTAVVAKGKGAAQAKAFARLGVRVVRADA